ncbi:MAG: ABC transporter ATP-binding protein [Dehalococcoidia bacterium]|nr:ABC transporter ATP-binding protein [Dehalococcoidia bacterium]
MEYAIQTDNLVKRYGNGFTALNGVSIKIKKGEVVGYLGPNGAGKTTTIKVLTKLIRPTSGQAFVNGLDVTRSPQEVLGRVGALIEVPGIYEYLTPYEMLTYFGRVYRFDKKDIDRRITETLQRVKLSDWTHKKVGSFSTGMHRRLAIAKAVFHRPEVLLLDEPVMGLDPIGIRDIRELIRQFQSEGMTVFLSSHLLGEVAEVCNSVIFLDKGKVVRSEAIGDIAGRRESKAVKVEFSRPLSNEEIGGIRAIPSVHNLEVTDQTIRIHFDGQMPTSYQILRELVAMNLEIISYNPDSLGLEDYYISLMGKEKGVQ